MSNGQPTPHDLVRSAMGECERLDFDRPMSHAPSGRGRLRDRISQLRIEASELESQRAGLLYRARQLEALDKCLPTDLPPWADAGLLDLVEGDE